MCSIWGFQCEYCASFEASNMGMFLLMLIDGHYLTWISPIWLKLGENLINYELKWYMLNIRLQYEYCANFEASNFGVFDIA